MEHFEYCYLVQRAHELVRFHEQAAKEGEEFHPVDSFTPLKCRLLAMALIRPLEKGGESALILRLRHPDGQDFSRVVAETQAKFFEEGYVLVPGSVLLDGLREVIAYSMKVPTPPR